MKFALGRHSCVVADLPSSCQPYIKPYKSISTLTVGHLDRYVLHGDEARDALQDAGDAPRGRITRQVRQRREGSRRRHALEDIETHGVPREGKQQPAREASVQHQGPAALHVCPQRRPGIAISAWLELQRVLAREDGESERTNEQEEGAQQDLAGGS